MPLNNGDNFLNCNYISGQRQVNPTTVFYKYSAKMEEKNSNY